MTKKFLDDDFLLQNKSAVRLYHDHAKEMPIIDYHCHLSPADIAQDRQFNNLTEAWLEGDHYKWRAMRTNGVPEKFITGSGSDREKFEKWSETVPWTIRNPLYHWTHLELKRYFGVEGMLLGPETSAKVYDLATEKLQEKDYSVQGLLNQMKVRFVCTTEDPIDTLEYHDHLKGVSNAFLVSTSFRPDKAMLADEPGPYNDYLDELSRISEIEIKSYEDLLGAVEKRHTYFHDHGCRVSDHGLEEPYAEDYKDTEVKAIFAKLRQRTEVSGQELKKFKSALMVELFKMNHARGWVQQIHLGPIRNNNTRLFQAMGPDIGCDSIGDAPKAKALSKFLDRLDQEDKLTKTILYNINPAENEMMATMIGNFQDGSVPGKIQYGSGWWFLDQKDGMEKQMNALSNMGLLSRFVGMLTDSRSFLSFPRHEYFRRILCNLIGADVENGELPDDMNHLGKIVEGICYYNARAYFNLDLAEEQI